MTVSHWLTAEEWVIVYGAIMLGTLITFGRKSGPKKGFMIALLGWFALEKIIYVKGEVELGNIAVGAVFILHCWLLTLRYEVGLFLAGIGLGVWIIIWTLLSIGGDPMFYKEWKNVAFLFGVSFLWIPLAWWPYSSSLQSSRLYLFCRKCLSDFYIRKLAR